MRPVDIVQPLEVGQVRIKQKQVEGWGPILVRHNRAIFSRRWTPPLPVYCWVIDHPEGTILVDTGPTPTDEWWHPKYHYYFYFAYRTRVGPEFGLVDGLEAHGFDVCDIDAIILSHCHADHGEGLEFIPDVPVYLEENENRYARSLRGRFWGSHPSCTPSRSREAPFSLSDGPVGPFDRSYEFPDYRGVSIVPTHGHTPYHCSVVVEGEGPTVLIGSDACLSLDQLDTHQPDGVAVRGRAGRKTLERIDRWRNEEEVIVLPSHDRRGYDALMEAR